MIKINVMKKSVSVFLTVIIVLTALSLSCVSASTKTDYQSYAKKLEKTTYSGELGAVYSKNSTTFKVWAPNSDSVRVKLFKTGTDTKKYTGYFKMATMTKSKSTGVWYVKIKGDLKNIYYTYVIKRGKKTYETTDIYAKACGVNGKRSMVVDLDSTNPKGWENDKHVIVNNQTDAKIWEIQIADFSSSKTSGVSEKNRGKYLAFTEKGTTVNGLSGAQSTCVDYLKELGVNYVQINPFYDFGSVDESDTSDNDKNYNWGYDPVNYNCPEGSYSSNPEKGSVRIKECKKMIQALHNAGIGVIMDVVYNHTLKDKNSNFNLTVPNYYYRINSDGTWSNGSGCGNDVATERKMVSKYIVDSVTYWAKEYHIDGFRFDLMGLIDVNTMNSVRASLDKLENGEKLIMYGEPWDLSTTTDSGTILANSKNMSRLSQRIGAFDDIYRDALKGSTSGADQGFIQSGERKANLRTGIAGQADSVTGWAKAPTQTVTYASCHDNLTLWDKLVKSVKGNDGNYSTRYKDLVAMNKLAGAITYTSQGISFMLAGEEFCRTKQGDENSYKSGFKINQIDWTYLETYGDVSAYYKGLIEIRDNISAFRDSTSETANNINYLENMPDGVLAYEIKDSLYNKVCVAFNSSDNEASVKLNGDWVQLADDKTAGMESLGNVGGTLKMPAKSAAILVDRLTYNSLSSKSDTGKVIVNYYKDDEVFKSYVVTGKTGESFDINPVHSVRIDYNITKKTGNTGTFSNSVKVCNFYCEPYDGNFSSVTFMYVDDSGKAITDYTIMTNRQGQQYTTPVIPSIDGYTLNLDKLPENGCGEFLEKDVTVNYYYNKKDNKDELCKVNIVYMSTDGKILGVDTKTGDRNQEYSTSELEFENYELYSVSENSKGVYDSLEQNVLYIYTPVSLTLMVITVILVIAGGILVALFVSIFFIRKKKRLMKNLEIN